MQIARSILFAKPKYIVDLKYFISDDTVDNK